MLLKNCVELIKIMLDKIDAKMVCKCKYSVFLIKKCF